MAPGEISKRGGCLGFDLGDPSLSWLGRAKRGAAWPVVGVLVVVLLLVPFATGSAKSGLAIFCSGLDSPFASLLVLLGEAKQISVGGDGAGEGEVSMEEMSNRGILSLQFKY